MKNFIALLAVVLMLPCIALADPAAILASDMLHSHLMQVIWMDTHLLLMNRCMM